MAATEQENRLTMANRHLLEEKARLVAELNHAGKRLALAERLAGMLRQSCGDWNEAFAALAQWEALK